MQKDVADNEVCYDKKRTSRRIQGTEFVTESIGMRMLTPFSRVDNSLRYHPGGYTTLLRPFLPGPSSSSIRPGWRPRSSPSLHCTAAHVTSRAPVVTSRARHLEWGVISDVPPCLCDSLEFPFANSHFNRGEYHIECVRHTCFDHEQKTQSIEKPSGRSQQHKSRCSACALRVRRF